MPLAAMKHDVDPRDALLAKLGNALDGFEIADNFVLIATYRRPEKTQGGIILTSGVLTEDIHQCKAGLVVKMGPSVDFPLLDIKLHDWVVLKPSDGWAMEILTKGEPVHCRLALDTQIRGRLAHPSLVW